MAASLAVGELIPNPLQPLQVLLTGEAAAQGEADYSLINHPSCGLVAADDPADQIITFVVGGRDAAPGQSPWAASLRYRHKDESFFSEGVHMCGGSVVSDRSL
jgi:hypothetical protein